MLKEPPVQIGDIVRWSYDAYNLRFVGFIVEIDVCNALCRMRNFDAELSGLEPWHSFDKYGNTMIKAEDAILSDDGCHYVADVRFTDG